ncbi:5403_t:CDS:2 [Entrophospora sp. SA101]|nr:5403_t:CDS:2 [Entrophospora sp. SA101]
MVEDVPKMHETVEEIERMIISKGYSSAIFVGHSLGTSVCSWMIKEAPKRVKDNFIALQDQSGTNVVESYRKRHTPMLEILANFGLSIKTDSNTFLPSTSIIFSPTALYSMGWSKIILGEPILIIKFEPGTFHQERMFEVEFASNNIFHNQNKCGVEPFLEFEM